MSGEFDIRLIPDMVNDVLFNSDPNMLLVSQLICALFVLMVVFLPMIMLHAKPMAMAIVGILALGALTVLGWLESYIFVLIVLLIAVFLARKGADFLGGG